MKRDPQNDGPTTDLETSCPPRRLCWGREGVNADRTLRIFSHSRNELELQHGGLLRTLAGQKVASIMLGSAVPKLLKGTVDNNFYNHYSDLSSVQTNWCLHHLGRWDVGANVWNLVARKTGDQIRRWSDRIAGNSLQNYYWNQSYGGVFSSAYNTSHIYVEPNLRLRHGGRTVLPAVARLWGKAIGRLPDYYRDLIEVPDALHPPKGFEVPIGLKPDPQITTPITIYPATSAATASGAWKGAVEKDLRLLFLGRIG